MSNFFLCYFFFFSNVQTPVESLQTNYNIDIHSFCSICTLFSIYVFVSHNFMNYMLLFFPKMSAQLVVNAMIINWPHSINPSEKFERINSCCDLWLIL